MKSYISSPSCSQPLNQLLLCHQHACSEPILTGIPIVDLLNESILNWQNKPGPCSLWTYVFVVRFWTVTPFKKNDYHFKVPSNLKSQNLVATVSSSLDQGLKPKSKLETWITIAEKYERLSNSNLSKALNWGREAKCMIQSTASQPLYIKRQIIVRKTWIRFCNMNYLHRWTH